ncbi:hypothetical protein HAX54_040473 [Datura stramonium]|uniref:Uncharacterized protein n=1 Tax=Datura stramonium TaxID=4076 RepID=A0ABS8VMP3_DATST|nr:hypothetical protein [Datura stramonium]
MQLGGVCRSRQWRFSGFISTTRAMRWSLAGEEKNDGEEEGYGRCFTDGGRRGGAVCEGGKNGERGRRERAALVACGRWEEGDGDCGRRRYLVVAECYLAGSRRCRWRRNGGRSAGVNGGSVVLFG